MHPVTIPSKDAEPGIDWDYHLDCRYEAGHRQVFLTGTQALVRLLLEQRWRDRALGLETAGFVSGYRGSPLAGLDLSLWQAKSFLQREDIRFQPAINEDLAATAVLGTQQVESDPQRQVDGVFALWYGKGPGVDRSGDALKHGNAFGTSPRGGVLVVAGDDHGCVSSSMPHQSEQAFQAWSMPVLNPASVAEYLSFGLYGFALSRFSGAWVGFKAISETVESGATVIPPAPPVFKSPTDYAPGPDGLHYRWPDLPSMKIETRLNDKLAAAAAFARANPIDGQVFGGRVPRLGIVTTGKAHLDLMAALESLGINDARAQDLGLAVYKVGLSYPLESEGILGFARGLEEVLVVEEKRAFVEAQLKDLLYNLPGDQRPRILGKRDLRGNPLVPDSAELSASRLEPILRALIERLDTTGEGRAVAQADRPTGATASFEVQKRLPYFCAGCPHNSSTVVPEGSKAFAGIGCHFMANWMGRDTEGLVQMGGEGVNWIGRAPFTGNGHVFQNLGDGTYYHSGAAAIRQAIAAGVNITYKILVNDAVAMTGGQPLDGPTSVPAIAAQLRAEGVWRIAVVSNDPDRTMGLGTLPPSATLHHRRELDAVQRELREVPGVSVLIYDQACAAETRRKRKRGRLPDPPRRVAINPAVCEACGDCSAQSNCVAVIPRTTPLGVKRQVDQTACNKDFSCLQGFCPSFVTLEGGRLRQATKPEGPDFDLMAEVAKLPLPEAAESAAAHRILIAGVGGTGVVTLGALLSMAAQLEGKGASLLDFMGFAQKGGAVLSHVKLTPSAAGQVPARIDLDQADVLLACDLVVGTSAESLAALAPGRGRVVGNLTVAPTADFVLQGRADPEAEARRRALSDRVGRGNCEFLDATELALHLFGNAVQANLILLGYAWQSGLLPVSLAALKRAVELNGVAVEKNLQALAAGRLASGDPGFLGRTLGPASSNPVLFRPESLEDIVAYRADYLTAYQDAAYAATYRALVDKVGMRESETSGCRGPLTRAVAENLFRLMAYKDEYEVARLLSSPDFLAELEAAYESKPRMVFHLAPPILNGPPDGKGRPAKRAFGPWLRPLLRILAKGRRLRGSVFDPFGYLPERREERQLIRDYAALIESLLKDLRPETIEAATAVAAAVDMVRGYGPVKAENIKAYKESLDQKLKFLASVVRSAAA